MVARLHGGHQVGTRQLCLLFYLSCYICCTAHNFAYYAQIFTYYAQLRSIFYTSVPIFPSKLCTYRKTVSC